MSLIVSVDSPLFSPSISASMTIHKTGNGCSDQAKSKKNPNKTCEKYDFYISIASA
jgi:hypothetical protein